MSCDCCGACIVLIVVVLILLIRYYFKPGTWKADGPVMRGKTVIVTGANSGIGVETVVELARYGAKVIMASRDTKKAEQARREIIDRLRSEPDQQDIEERLVIEELDLASFASIRSFASRIDKLPKLDVLINNAGIAFQSSRQLTKEGLEVTMGTNHFGHFLLTNLLLPILKRSAPSRIVVVSGDVYKIGKIEFDDLNSERSYGGIQSYANSKLANILFTRELARKLEGTGVVVNALHPGVIRTNLQNDLPRIVLLVTGLFSFLYKTANQGAMTTVYLAASQSPDALGTGRYFRDCKLLTPSRSATDDAVAKKLWEVSERITKLE